MLIDNNGVKKGVVPIDKALQEASKLSLDLVQVSGKDSNPTVCKIMDYGKMLFSKKKNISASRVKSKKNHP